MLGTFTELQIPFGVVCLESSRTRTVSHPQRAGCVPDPSLQVLARTLRNTVWPTDFVGSWTEGRFLVLLSGCREDALQAVSTRILKMMASATIQWWGEELVSHGCDREHLEPSPAIPSSRSCSGWNAGSSENKVALPASRSRLSANRSRSRPLSKTS
jgi:hypothetical protein